MIAYIIRRSVMMVPTFVLVTIIVFLSVRLIPGNVVDIMLNDQQIGGTWDRAAIEHVLGLDVPIHVQYGRWFINILHGDFGNSIWTGASVTKEIIQRLPITFELGILALLTGLIIAIPIGMYSAVRQDTIGDFIARSFSIFCIAIPGFWLGTLVMVFPTIWWGWSPPMQYVSFIDDPLTNLQMFIIPAVIMGMSMSGITMRMMRTMMLEVLRQDYIRTAWAKGLRERVVIFKHALRNALIPIITIIGLQLPVLVGGAVIIERIFNLPGIGRYMLDSINRRDYLIISGVNTFVAIFVLVTNFLVDLTYSFMDPRIRYK